jgi:hypothetical protein
MTGLEPRKKRLSAGPRLRRDCIDLPRSTTACPRTEIRIRSNVNSPGLDLRAYFLDLCERSGMSPTVSLWRVLAALMLIAAGNLGAATPETHGQARTEFPSFKMIADRNIFNANRSRGRSGSEAKPRVVESFALLGTLSYERGRIALFDGTSSDYRKDLKPGATIAGYKIADIAVNGVKLEADGKQIDLRVGSQMRREDEGEWQVAAITESSSGSSRSGSAESRSSRNGGPDLRSARGGGPDSRSNRFDRDSRFSRREGSDLGSNRRSSSEISSDRNTSSSATAEDSSSGDPNEVLKKLMQQREQELKK